MVLIFLEFLQGFIKEFVKELLCSKWTENMYQLENILQKVQISS